jgi:hypothetical protein
MAVKFQPKGRPSRKAGKSRGVTISDVKRLIVKESEVKRIDSTSTAGVSSFGTITTLSAIAQGTADNQRIGNRVRARSLILSGIWQGADTTNFVRVMIVRGNNRNLLLADMPSLYGIPDNSLMTVLYDHKMNLANIGDFNIYQKPVDFRHKLNNMQCHWDQADLPLQGHIYLYLLSDSTAVNHPSFSYELAMYYTDT